MSHADNTKVSHILGIGLDNDDGHTRLTRARDFTVAGGSEETHTRMTEALMHTQEALERKGRTIEGADPREIGDLLRKYSN